MPVQTAPKMNPDHFGFTNKELRKLRSLKDPHGIQRFLDDMPYHLEDTAWSPRKVLAEGSSHCLEGAIFGAAALRANGYPPLLLDFEAAEEHLLRAHQLKPDQSLTAWWSAAMAAAEGRLEEARAMAHDASGRVVQSKRHDSRLTRAERKRPVLASGVGARVHHGKMTRWARVSHRHVPAAQFGGQRSWLPARLRCGAAARAGAR